MTTPSATPAAADDFSVSLFDCFASPGGATTCCYVTWCTPCAYGSLVEKLPEDATACGGSWWGGCCVFYLAAVAGSFLSGWPSGWLAHLPTRTALRRQYGLRSPGGAKDCLTLWCCEPCALCQELNEQQRRREGGAAIEAGGMTTTMAPPVQPEGMETGKAAGAAP